MSKNHTIPSRYQCGETLNFISQQMVFCADDQEKEYRIWVLELGQWLVDARKCGMGWGDSYLRRLEMLMSRWRFLEQDRGASLKVRFQILRLALEVVRMNKYSSLAFVHPARRPQPRRRALAAAKGPVEG
jgi:hypothetical protein